MTVEIWQSDGRWREIKALIDSGAESNFIFQLLVKKAALVDPNSCMTAVHMLDGCTIMVYGTHDMYIHITDDEGKMVKQIDLFFTINLQGYNIILGYSWLQTQNPKINWMQRVWIYTEREKLPEIVDVFMFATDAAKTERFYAVRYTPLLLTSIVELPPEYEEFQDMFSKEDVGGLPPHGQQEHAIELEGSNPLYGPIYSLSEHELKVLREYISDGLEMGWLYESSSPAGAPILFTPKKNDELHLCVDYRGLNWVTWKNRYPLPLIGELMDRLEKAKVFTKLDLHNAYH
jgi:hypothetical protein